MLKGAEAREGEDEQGQEGEGNFEAGKHRRSVSIWPLKTPRALPEMRVMRLGELYSAGHAESRKRKRILACLWRDSKGLFILLWV